MKDEALDLALEALENGKRVRNAEGGTKYQPDLEDKTITAIKQALAAPTVQPVKPSLWEQYHAAQPAPVQAVDTDELTILWMLINAWRDAPAPALHICGKINSYVLALKQPTPPAAQPAVPDAMTSADIQKHIEYVAGWNECRQAMLEMMK